MNELHGLLLIDKPQGFTSHDVVGRVRGILKQKSVGHTGTLDPIATGLMILVLGEATKLSDFLMFTDKVYRLRARLGVRTDSLDATGKVLSETEVDLPEETVRAAALQLQGDFDWPVPIFSAAKVGGKKLYEFGRKEISVELPIKRMRFSDIEISEVTGNSVAGTLRCSKGSFVRTWCAQLGEKLEVGGHLAELSRLQVGSYRLDQALSLDKLAQGREKNESLGESFIPLSEALPDFRAVRVSPKEERLLSNGQIPHDLGNRLIVEQKEALRRGEPIGIRILASSGGLISILVAEPGRGLRIRRVFRLDQDQVSY